MNLHRLRRSGRPNWARLPAGGFLAAALLAGCARPPAPLRIVFEDDVRTLDPHHHNDVVAWSLLANFFDAVVRFDAEFRLQPALATRWEARSPGHLRIYLRPQVRFHNGSPLTAGDVVASLLRARDDPASRIRHLLEGVQAVTAADELTIDVHTSGASPTLLNRLALVFVMPAAEASRAEVTAPVGTGAYRFVRRRSDGVVEAEAFVGWRGRPPIAAVEFAFVPGDGDRARLVLSGQADVAVRLSPSAAEVIGRRPGRRLITQPRTAVQLLEFNPAHGTPASRRALAAPRVRRALLLATNRQRYVNIAYRGSGAVATQYLHPVVFGFDPAIAEVPYNPQHAADLLRQAGVAAGDIELSLACGAASAELAELLAEDWTRLGVRVGVHELPFTELIDRTATPQINARLFGRLCTTGDAAEFFNPTFHSPLADGTYGTENFTGYADAMTDALLEAASREGDPQHRLALLQQAQRRVLAALPILPLTLSWSQTGVRQGLQFTPRHDQWLDVASFRWQ